MRVAPNLSDALANISDKIVRRFATDKEDLENLIAIRQQVTFLELINKSNIYNIFKNFTKYRKKTNKVKLFSFRHLPNILKYREYR